MRQLAAKLQLTPQLHKHLCSVQMKRACYVYGKSNINSCQTTRKAPILGIQGKKQLVQSVANHTHEIAYFNIISMASLQFG